jgi:ectoine hydroxylase-related dioxygenase (phytanoyl-CoA dioxygenase family)
MADVAVAKLAADIRLQKIAEDFIGTPAIPYRATLFQKTGRANWLVKWHQDTALPLQKRFPSAEWGPWSKKNGVLYAHAPAARLERMIALRIQLDDSVLDNGPLRVVPNTHNRGVLNDTDVIEIANKLASVKCLASKGGVIAMRPLLIHASSKARIDLPRRVLHIEYTNSLDLGDGIRLAIA